MKKTIILVTLMISWVAFTEAQQGVFPSPIPPPSEPGDQPPLRKKETGFYGQSLLFCSPVGGIPLEGTPLRTFVSVYDADGKLVRRVVSNPVGQFYAYLAPGNYMLVATLPGQRLPPRILSQYTPPTAGTIAAPVSVTVNTNQLMRVEINYACDAI